MTSRRDALRSLAGMAALPFLRTFGVDELTEIGRHAHALADLRRSTATPAPLRALTAAEYAIVSQAGERIIPRTATPGATDARVADFIDVMLADWYEASARERFKTGLSELDGRASKLAGRVFVKMTEEQQTEVLETLDRELSNRRQSGLAEAEDHWFAMLKHLTIWGYYTSRPGIVEELRVELMPGRHNGNAPY
jgi:gluconate 2-dehydrogenase gamma chain